jgi:hypothetical protein
MHLRILLGCAAAALILTGCGKGGGSSPTSTATTEAQRERSALPTESVAKVPSDVNCGSEKPVWVNTHTKAYHTSDDPYYGRTKNGKYMCASAATSEGDHPAGQRHKGTKSNSSGSSGN